MASPTTMEPWSDVTSGMIDDVTTEMNITLGDQVLRELKFWVPPLSFLLGIFGNSLCLAAICSSKYLMAPASKIYMAVILLMCEVHLTVAVIAWLPSSFVDYFNFPQIQFLRGAILTDLGCQLLSYFRSASIFVLAWILVSQTGERYATLSRPFQENKNSIRTTILVTFFIIVVGFGIQTAKFFGVTVKTSNGTYPLDPIECGLNDLGEVIEMVDVLIIFLLSPIFLFILALCLTCMINIHRSLRKKWRYKKSTLLVGFHQSELSITMAYAYSLGLLPYFVWSVLFLVSLIWGQKSIVDVIAMYLKEGAELLLILLSGINVLYFIIAGKRFRAVLCRLMCGCICKDTKEAPSDEDSMRTPSTLNAGSTERINGQHLGKGVNDNGASLGQINMVFEDHNNSEMTQL